MCSCKPRTLRALLYCIYRIFIDNNYGYSDGIIPCFSTKAFPINAILCFWTPLKGISTPDRLELELTDGDILSSELVMVQIGVLTEGG